MRTDALNIFSDASQEVKDKLLEIQTALIDGIFASSLSAILKNSNYSGSPDYGSVEFKRFANASVDTYGTARAAGKGKALKNTGKVTLNVDQPIEIIEEVNKFDINMYGETGIVEKRSKNHVSVLAVNLDKAFFAVIEGVATVVNLTGITAIEKQVEKVIQTAIKTQNQWVEGVDKSMLALTLSPEAYGELRNHLDKVTVPNVNSAVREMGYFHGVAVYENIRQTADILCFSKEAVGQPVVLEQYQMEKIGLSNDFAIELFGKFGTKAITPDLCYKATITSSSN
ncbi:MAG: hypothetical protein PHE32_03945 [Candidatus Shapirobacteria bacterium]|nr:hypothetical protein [Candidatus Shapirobacteria bacterium]